MITAAVESLTERLEEMKAMFPLHAAELDTYHDRRPLDPQYGEYLRRDANGQILFVAVRKQGTLIGYFVGFVVPALHYQSTLTCLQDIFFIMPEHRDGHATGALKMFRAVIREAKRRGVKEIRVGSKLGAHDVQVLFKHMGFKPVETIHSLWIGDQDA